MITIEPSPAVTRRFEALYDDLADRVMAYALRHVGADAAEDVVAETFLVAWRRLADVPEPALPWLLVVARNVIAHRRRSGAREARLSEQVTRLAALAAPAGGPEAAVADRDALLHAVARLSDADREALLLTAWDGLSAREAAAVLGCSSATFQVRLHRARRRLLKYADEPATEAPRAGAPTNVKRS